MNKKRVLRVLEFYADRDKYSTNSTGFAAQYDPEDPEVIKDNGRIARDLLREIKHSDD